MKIRDQVVAKRFVLADDEGKPVAYLTGRESGIIGLTIAGAGGAAPMVSIGVESDGGPNIVVHGLDERGTRGERSLSRSPKMDVVSYILRTRAVRRALLRPEG
jgi:hypothetical protein